MNKADLTEAPLQAPTSPRFVQRSHNILVDSIRTALVSGERSRSVTSAPSPSPSDAHSRATAKNGAEIPVPPRRIPVFRARKRLKEALNAEFG